MSVGNWFQRKGAVNVNDLLVIRREEGLDGRIRETAEEDLVLALFCTHVSRKWRVRRRRQLIGNHLRSFECD